MKITNVHNLPDMLVRAVEKEYEYRDKRYSITSLLDPERVMMLKRRYNSQITQDISECIFMLHGTKVHYELENIELKENEYVEKHLEHTFDNGYVLSGIIDHIYDFIDDYKTVSVYSVIYGSNDEKWRKQLEMGSYLWYKETGKWISRGRIICLLKDWNRRDSKTKPNYPKFPVEVIEYDLGEPEVIEKWILDKFNRIMELEKMTDFELPLCSLEERFNSGTKYAVKRKNNKVATKLHNTLENAREHLINLEMKYPNLYEIEERKAEDKRCLEYCSCNQFCPYYLLNYDEAVKDIHFELMEESQNGND